MRIELGDDDLAIAPISERAVSREVDIDRSA
jgi:hypothetical protein